MGSALAQAETYPRAVASGDSLIVEYGPGPQGNIVGGGASTTRLGTEPHVIIQHLDDNFAQQRTDGRVPVLTGTGEDVRIEWIDAPAPYRFARTGRPCGPAPYGRRRRVVPMLCASQCGHAGRHGARHNRRAP